MKWGTKKPTTATTTTTTFSSSSLISHVFPMSWLSKFKHKSSNVSEPKPRKVKLKGKWNTSPSSMKSPRLTGLVGGAGKFYGLLDDNDDAFWRLSFGKDSVEEKKMMMKKKKKKKSKEVGLQSVWYDSDVEIKAPFSSCPNCRGKVSQQNFNGVLKREAEREREVGYGEKRSTRNLEKEVMKMAAARTVWRDEKEKREETTRSNCRFVPPPPMASRYSSLKTIEEEALNSEQNEEFPEEKMSFDWRNLRELKSDKQRKSLYVSREQQRKRAKQSKKARVYSPRTASRNEICKVKALEDKKKAKLKMMMMMKKKKKNEEEARERVVVEAKTTAGLDSFAVVKSSYDPQKDFRDSMVEMIMEKKITKPDELEELLACYLTLNSDVYHDLIIKVFRQVWFELDQGCFGCELQKEQPFQ